MSKYGVFIIESLRPGDFLDGKTLGTILKLSKIPHIYRKPRSKYEFIKAIHKFKESDLRYLHISCHADMNGIELNGKDISNSELSKIFRNKIKKRRIFLSTCEGGNRNMATVVISECEGQSIIGTPIKLDFDKAALFWPPFYHVIHNIDAKRMKRDTLITALKKCVNLFEIPINYYHGINGKPKYLRRYKIKPNKKTKSKIIPVSENI